MDKVTTYQVRLQDFIEDKLSYPGIFGPSIDKESVSLAMIANIDEMLFYSTDELKGNILECLRKGPEALERIEDKLKGLSLKIAESKANFAKAIKIAEKNKRKRELEEDEDDE